MHTRVITTFMMEMSKEETPLLPLPLLLLPVA